MDASFEKTSGAQTNRFMVNEDQDPPFSPKDGGLLFDLAEGYKQQNGGGPAAPDSHHTTDPFFDERPTNGKRTSDHFDDETHDDDEDDDFGPETDVDAVDDVLLSPSIAAARLLVEGIAGKEQEEGVTEESFDICMKETSALPIEAVLEISSGLVDNVGESGGEESEDEWNYFKGENKTDSNTSAHPDTQTQHTTQEIELKSDAEIDDNMSSPLNPEAAPFVPVSPTPGSEGSALPSRLLDEVVSQSPQKPQPMDDINIPEACEFESEVCTRLADLGEDREYLNGHSDNSALSSQENLKETLHGNEKHLAGFGFGDDEPSENRALNVGDVDVDEAEFDRVQKDTTDFCDIRVAHATHGDRGFEDEGIDEELYERLKNKERDPMSMSFYQEKDEDTCETQLNPFDLNAVQTLPDNSDDDFGNDCPQPDNSLNAFICGTETFSGKQESEVTSNEIFAAISDLDNAVINGVESFDVNEMNKSIPPMGFAEVGIDSFGQSEDIHAQFCENSAQPVTEQGEGDSTFEALSTVSPHPEVEEDLFQTSHSPVVMAMSPVPMAYSPVPTALSPEPIATSPEPTALSPEPTAMSPEPTAMSLEPTAISPEPTAMSPEPTAMSPEPTALSPEPIALSPEPIALSPEPTALSPEPTALSPEPTDLITEPSALSPEPTALSPVPRILSPVLTGHDEFLDQAPKSPEPMAQSPIPMAVSPEPVAILESEEIISEPVSHLNDFTAHSPSAMSPEPFQEPPAALSPAPFEQSSAYFATSPLPASPSPTPAAIPSAESPQLLAHSPAVSPMPVPNERDDYGYFEEKFDQQDDCQESEMPISELQADTGFGFEMPSSHDIDDRLDMKIDDLLDKTEEVSEFIETKTVDAVNAINEIIPEDISQLIEDEAKSTLDVVTNTFVNEFSATTESAPETLTMTNDNFDFNNSSVQSLVNDVSSRFDPATEQTEIPSDLTVEIDVPQILERVSSPVVDLCQLAAAPSSDLADKMENFTNDISNQIEIVGESDPIPVVESINEENVPENITKIEVAAIAAVASVAAVAAVGAVVADKKAPVKAKPSPAAIKKAAPAKTALSPTKPTASKTTSATTAIKKTTAAPLKSVAATPPKSAAAPRARPATLMSPTSKPAAKPAVAAVPKPKAPAGTKTTLVDKKPLTNGVEVKREPIKRPVPGSVSAKTPVAAKTSVTAAPAKTIAAAPARTAPRPATAPARPAAAAARPAAARPTATATSAKPKPQPTPATRAPISKTTSTARAPVADKLTKDTTNKQISASRPTPAPRAGLAPRSTDLKTTTKTTTKTSTTAAAPKSTNPPPIRRPTSATTKTTVTKTTTKTTTTKLVGGKAVTTEKLNGTLEKSIKEDSLHDELCMNGTPLITDIPLKDSSPQHVDNSLLPIIDAAAD